ncbi:MAG TPA: sigma-70 family RNA polymerase sigma factor [Deinococcales bacterium]|nr:sigma-70 family RNA polymerase sigma factor [Deinococcales bacterium]
MEASDETLLSLVSGRDEAALRALYGRHSGHVHAVARRILRDPEDVKEVVQDTFVRVWTGAERFDASLSQPRTWILTIAHRLALNALRDRPGEVLSLEDWDAPTAQHPGSADSIDGLYVEGLLSSLEPRERALLDLAYYKGHSHSEIALLTGLPLGTVKTRLRAALGLLRARMGVGEA